MPEEGKEEGKGKKERRSGKERRKGDLDELFRRLISTGAFEDRRKGERRKSPSPQDQLNIRIYLN